MTERALCLRPHHGLCIPHFVGEGYDAPFTENMTRLTKLLKHNPRQSVILRSAADVLCDACPNNRGGVCETEEKAARYDARCLTLCNLRDGQRLSWEAFQKTVAERILRGTGLQSVCWDCGWFSLCTQVYQNAPEK